MSWPLQRQNEREIRLGRTHGEAPVFVPRIIGPCKAAGPIMGLAQQPPSIAVDGKDDVPERALPEMAPSKISVTIFL